MLNFAQSMASLGRGEHALAGWKLTEADTVLFLGRHRAIQERFLTEQGLPAQQVKQMLTTGKW